MKRASTRSISIAVPPQVVLDLVADPTALPRWAPAPARAVRSAGGDHWVVEKGGREVRIRVRVSRELGTVDFLMADAPPGVELGTFTRVVRNGSGGGFFFQHLYVHPRRPQRLRQRVRLHALLRRLDVRDRAGGAAGVRRGRAPDGPRAL